MGARSEATNRMLLVICDRRYAAVASLHSLRSSLCSSSNLTWTMALIIRHVEIRRRARRILKEGGEGMGEMGEQQKWCEPIFIVESTPAPCQSYFPFISPPHLFVSVP